MINLIYTQNGGLFISKETADWKTWQERLPNYMTNLNFNNIQECSDFLKDDFKLTIEVIKHITESIEQSSGTYFELHFEGNRVVKVIEIEQIK